MCITSLCLSAHGMGFCNQYFTDMALAAYSGTPLIKKLGLKEGLKLRLVNAPAEYAVWLEKDVSGQVCPSGAVPDWVHVFAVTSRDFEREMRKLASVWLRYPQV